MKQFAVIFVVQAETLDDADRQARAYVNRPSFAPFAYPPAIKTVELDNLLQDLRPVATPYAPAPAPFLDMIACRTCGRRWVDDGWVQFCNEECAVTAP